MKKLCFVLLLLLSLLLTGAAMAAEGDAALAFGELEYILLPDGTACITGYAGEAVEVIIPDEIEGAVVTVIGEYAFAHQSELASVHLPDTVTTIGSHAFYWCTGLRVFEMSAGVTAIGDQAFYYCSNLSWVTLPAEIESIAANAFRKCPCLTIVSVPGGLAERYAQQNGIYFSAI